MSEKHPEKDGAVPDPEPHSGADDSSSHHKEGQDAETPLALPLPVALPSTVATTATAAAEPPSEKPVAEQQPDYSVFTTWQKRGIVLGAAAGAFFSPLTAQIYFPALTTIASDFDVSISQINLTVTTYMIFQGLTPMVVGSFADVSGRRPAYLICFLIYIGANIGCALAPNYAALLVLRMVQSAGSSTTVALAQGVVADVATSAERGQYVGMATVPVMLAPAVGPVLGGVVTQFLGWRWIFWILTVVAAAVCLLMGVFMPETCRPIVGNGSVRPHAFYRPWYSLVKDALAKRRRRRSNDNGGGAELAHAQSNVSVKERPRLSAPNPWSSIQVLLDPEMALLLLYTSLVGSGFYAVVTAMSPQFAAIYGYSDLLVGVMYVPLAAGAVVASLVVGRLLNWNYARHCARLGLPYERRTQQDLAAFPIERARLEVTAPMLGVTTAATAAWGWIIQERVPVGVACVVLFVMGATFVGFTNSTTALLIDLNPKRASAATAANNITRCLVGAAASAAIQPMIAGVGNGWAFVILAALFVAGSPALLVIMVKGMGWRKQRAERARAREEAKEGKEGKHVEVGGGGVVSKE